MPTPPSNRRPSWTGEAPVIQRDDTQPATRAELRVLGKRIERLESLPARVSELVGEFGFHRAGIERHIKGAARDAVEEELRPYASQLQKVDEVKEIAQESRSILLEQEMRAKITSEQKTIDEALKAEKAAARVRRNTTIAVLVPVFVAIISLITAAIASHAH